MAWRFVSVQFSGSVMSDSLQPHELQHTRPPCPSPTPRVHPNPCPLSQWCHPAISSSVIPFSSFPQSLPESGSFPMSQLFTRGGQSIGVSASTSILPMNTQDWFPLGWTGWISFLSKGLSRVFSNTTVQKQAGRRAKNLHILCSWLQRQNLHFYLCREVWHGIRVLELEGTSRLSTSILQMRKLWAWAGRWLIQGHRSNLRTWPYTQHCSIKKSD